MSVRKAFEDGWYDRFPDTPVPTNLSFLDKEGVSSLAEALDSAERNIKKLESELSRQQFIYDVLQQLNVSLAARRQHATASQQAPGPPPPPPLAVTDERPRKTPVTTTPSAPRPRIRAPQQAAVMAKIELGNKTNRPAIDPKDEVRLLDDDRKATTLSRFYEKSNMYRPTSKPTLLDSRMKFKPQPAIPPSTTASRMPPGFKPIFTRDSNINNSDRKQLSVTTVNPGYKPGGGQGSLYTEMFKSTGSDLDRENHRQSQFVDPEPPPGSHADESYLERDLDSIIPPTSTSPPPRPRPLGEAFSLDVVDGPSHAPPSPRKTRSADNIYEETMEFWEETPSSDVEMDDADEDEGASSSSDDDEPLHFNMRLLIKQQTLSRANALYMSAEEIEMKTQSSVEEQEKSASEKRRQRRMAHHYEHIEPQWSRSLSVAPNPDYGKPFLSSATRLQTGIYQARRQLQKAVTDYTVNPVSPPQHHSDGYTSNIILPSPTSSATW